MVIVLTKIKLNCLFFSVERLLTLLLQIRKPLLGPFRALLISAAVNVK